MGIRADEPPVLKQDPLASAVYGGIKEDTKTLLTVIFKSEISRSLVIAESLKETAGRLSIQLGHRG
jgi:hypothetical protein